MIDNKFRKIIFTLLIAISILPCIVLAEEPPSSPTTTPEVSPAPTVEPTISVSGLTLSLNKVSMVEGDTKQLEVTVSPSDATNQNVTWTSSDVSVATVSEDGKITAIKAGTTTIIVTSNEDNNKQTSCVVEVTEKASKADNQKSSDATIKSLTINNGKLDKEFNSSTYKYTVTIDNTVSSLDFDIVLNDKKAGRMISNNSSLITGRVVKVVVTAEDGSTKTYEFTIKKAEANLNLKSLKIKGYALNETFNADALEYTAEIPYDAVDVTIEANAEDSNAKVKISGDTGLIVGTNTVTITVTDTSGNERKYKITVTRLAEDEKVSTGNSSKYVSSTSNKTSALTNSSSSNNHTLSYVFVTIGCLIVFAIGAIGIYFYAMTSTKIKDKKKHKSISTDNEIESPLVVENNSTSIMPGDLEETREFRADVFNKNDEVKKDIERLFDDE